ncbi:MAG: hypothetical protein ACRD9R_22325 [Pyrinomonadaceae bacterium]
MSQLAALVWLKWRLFRNSMTRRRGGGAANRVASLLTLGAAMVFALLVACGMGAATYFLTSEATPLRGARGAAELKGVFLVFILLSTIYLTWATVPLSVGGGGEFAPGRLLLYPVSLRKLFALDVLSELSSLASIFAAPAILAIALGAGLARGRVLAALAVGVCGLLFGVAVSKLLTTCVGALTRARRARGEALVALVGAVAAFAGVLFGRGAELFERAGSFPAGLRWTPPGAVTLALTSGLREGGAAGDYWQGILLLLVYTASAILLAYRVARRSLTSAGGGTARRKQAAADPSRRGAGALAGWRLPLASPQLSSIVEKELRYHARNAQLRVVALMPLVLTLAFGLMGSSERGSAAAGAPGGLFAPFMPYLDGGRAAFSVLYVFMITSALSCNLFGYEGAGMRALVLAPVARRTILVGKNVATLCVSLLMATAVVAFNQLLYRDVSTRAILFASLCFVAYASIFTTIGNWLSIRFPKRLEFGRRLNASGMTGLLLLPIFLLAAALPALAVWAGYAARSRAVVYVILAAFAAAGVASYLLLVRRQERSLQRRELDILEAVTGRDAA